MQENKKLAAMREGGKKLAQIREQLAQMVKPGLTLLDIEKKSVELIEKTGGEVAFSKVPGYQWSTCINVNDGVVHGIPNGYVIKNGDVVSIDVGLFYKGFYTDTSTSVIAGEDIQKAQAFLDAGREALDEAIQAAKMGNRIGHISQAMEQTLKKYGWQPVKSLTGHGVGAGLHEQPYVPCFLGTKIEQTPKLKENQTLALEVIYTQGKPTIVVEDDDWTISTKDGKLAGLFEETVAVTADGPEILTRV